MRKLALMLCVFLLLASPGFTSVEKILKTIETDLEDAIKKIELLTIEVAEIKTSRDAVKSVEAFIAILVQFHAKVTSLESEAPSNLDPKPLLDRVPEFTKKIEVASHAYGLAIGSLPSRIIESDEFFAALEKLIELMP